MGSAPAAAVYVPGQRVNQHTVRLGTVKGADRAGNVSVDFGCATGVKKMPASTTKLVRL